MSSEVVDESSPETVSLPVVVTTMSDVLVVSEPVKQLQNPSRLNELQLDFSPQLVPSHTRPNWSQERLPRCFQFPMGYCTGLMLPLVSQKRRAHPSPTQWAWGGVFLRLPWSRNHTRAHHFLAQAHSAPNSNSAQNRYAYPYSLPI